MLDKRIGRGGAVGALVAGAIAIYSLSGLFDAQTKLRDQQARTAAIVQANGDAQAVTCWRSKLGGPLFVDALYKRFHVFTDPELLHWYVGVIPRDCPPLPRALQPPARYYHPSTPIPRR